MKIKVIISGVMFSILLCSFTNTTYPVKKNKDIIFKLNWKKGDTKKLKIWSHAKIWDDGKIIQDTTITSLMDLSVTDEKKDSYLITLKSENMVLGYIKQLPKKYQYKNSANEVVNYNYRLNRSTLRAELLNKREVDLILKNSYDFAIDKLKKENSKESQSIKMKLEKLYEKLEHSDVFVLLMAHYNKKYKIDETVHSIDTLDNPFNLEGFKGSDVKTLVSEKRGKKKIMNIKIEKKYDIDGFLENMTKMSEMMSSKKIKEMDNVVLEKGTQVVSKLSEGLSLMMINLLKSLKIESTDSVEVSQKKNKRWPNYIYKKNITKMVEKNKDKKVVLEVKMIVS